MQDAVFGDPHTTPEHPELEAAAIAVVTTFQVRADSVTKERMKLTGDRLD